MSTDAAVAATVAVLAGAGAAPTLALVGARWVAIPLAVLAGAVVAALAAGALVALGWTLVGWFTVLALLLTGAAAALWLAVPERRPWPRAAGVSPDRNRGTAPAGPRPGRWLVPAAALAVGAGCAAALRDLSVPAVGFDTRMIWLMRAGWFLQPHRQVLADLRNPGLWPAHAGYPPLVSAVGSLTWAVSGPHTPRAPIVVVAVLNACALFVAAWVLVEAGRRGARRARAGPVGTGRIGTGRVGGTVVALAGVAAALLLTAVATGTTAPFLTNGYADPLWALAVVAAVGFGLQLPRRRGDLGVVAVLLAVAALTKIEGAVAAGAVALLVLARLRCGRGHRRRPRTWPSVAWGAVAVLGAAAWPALMAIEGTSRDVENIGPADASVLHRAHATVDAARPHLAVLVVAVAVALVGVAILRGWRRRLGLAGDGWAWSALTVAVVVIGAAYVTGPGDIDVWLETSVHRTTVFPALEAWWITALWGLVGVATLAGAVHARHRPAAAVEEGAVAPRPVHSGG